LVPVLRYYKNKEGCYARAAIGQSIITIQISEEGQQRLEKEGFIEDGVPFPQTLFNQLIRQREAFTKAGARAEALKEAEKSQFFFDFDADVAAQEILPRCSETGTFNDLHLVIHHEPNGGPKLTQLLGETARKCLVAHVLLNVPVTLIDRRALGQLIASEKVDSEQPAIQQLSRWLGRDSGGGLWDTHDITI